MSSWEWSLWRLASVAPRSYRRKDYKKTVVFGGCVLGHANTRSANAITQKRWPTPLRANCTMLSSLAFRNLPNKTHFPRRNATDATQRPPQDLLHLGGPNPLRHWRRSQPHLSPLPAHIAGPPHPPKHPLGRPPGTAKRIANLSTTYITPNQANFGPQMTVISIT
jgi:hypothetical protein